MGTETKPPTKMGKQDLIHALNAAGYTEENLLDSDGNKLKRPALLEKFQAHQKGEEGLAVLPTVSEEEDDVGVQVEPDTEDGEEVEEFADEPEPQPEPSGPSDPDWTQFVLGKFLPDEVDGKNPRVEGLRRIASELVGELVVEGCDLVAAPTEDNRFRACVKAWGVFITPEGREKRFEALADAHSDNCFEDYATYLVAMADTRAKGRMFRNALGLRRVVAAEEVSKTVATAADVQQGGAIHAGQIGMIRLMADRNKISLVSVFDDLGIKHELNEQIGDVNLQALSYEEALSVMKCVREMTEAKEKE